MVENNKRLFVKTADGWLEILELQQEGRKRMSAEEFLHEEFLRGNRFAEKERFE